MPLVWRLRGQALATPALLFALPADAGLARSRGTAQALVRGTAWRTRAHALEASRRDALAEAHYSSADLRAGGRSIDASYAPRSTRARMALPTTGSRSCAAARARTAEAIAGFRRAIALRPDLVRRALPPGRDAVVDEGREGRGRGAAHRGAAAARPRRGAVLPGAGPQGAGDREARSRTCGARSRSRPALHPAAGAAGRAAARDGRRGRRRRRVPPGGRDRRRLGGSAQRARAWRSWRRARPRRRSPPSARWSTRSPRTAARATTSAPSLLQRGDLDGRRRGLSRADPPRARATPRRTTTWGWRSSRRTTSRPPRASCARRWCSTRACPRPRSRSASCCGRPGARPEAMAPFRAAIAARPGYAEAHYMLGLVLQAGGRPRAARSRGSARPSGSVRATPEAHRGLGQLLAAAGRRGRCGGGDIARPSGSRRVKADAQAAAFALSAGQASAARGDRAAALAQPARGGPARSRQRAAHYQLALVLQQAGAAREAARHFAEAHRLAP